MSMPNAAELELLQHLLQNSDWANIGDATGLRGSTTAGSVYIALFTGDPGETGSVAAECAYTSYARVAVARNGTQWEDNGSNGLQNANVVSFPQATGGSETATHFAVCKAGTTSVADIIVSGALSSGLAISNGITPEFAAGALDVTAD